MKRPPRSLPTVICARARGRRERARDHQAVDAGTRRPDLHHAREQRRRRQVLDAVSAHEVDDESDESYSFDFFDESVTLLVRQSLGSERQRVADCGTIDVR